jgi:CheY-like chemotaxis protein
MIERQMVQLVRLVDDLLDVSRISRGRIDLRKETVDLASTVLQAVEAARSVTSCLGINLNVTLPLDAVSLHADPVRLAQVIGNLLNHACKFTVSGGHSSLSVEREADEVLIRVSDTGIGIAKSLLPRVFDMFMQIDTSLERSRGGQGIGLTLVRSLVEMHGGTVEAFSAGPGQGSEFLVRLPIPGGSGASVPPGQRASSAASRRILVVDDNRDAASSLAELLALTGNETSVAHDGLEAVEAAAATRPDVILMDIGLPRLNGYEAARRVRQLPFGKDIVLVALTGWGHEEDRRKSREAGFDGHVVKPVDYQTLMRLLAELLPTKS